VSKITRSDEATISGLSAVDILNQEYDARITYPMLSGLKQRGALPLGPILEAKIRELGELLKAERAKRGWK
jgi:hypothetical protein